MGRSTPLPKETLEQKLYRLSAQTNITLRAEALRPTLRDVELEGGPAVIVHLMIDASSPATAKAAAAHLREIADAVEGAAI